MLIIYPTKKLDLVLPNFLSMTIANIKAFFAILFSINDFVIVTSLITPTFTINNFDLYFRLSMLFHYLNGYYISITQCILKKS